jgi:transmembrane sensor
MWAIKASYYYKPKLFVMKKEDFIALFRKYEEGNCNLDEIKLLEAWYHEEAKRISGAGIDGEHIIDQEARLGGIFLTDQKKKSGTMIISFYKRYKIITVAASFFILLSLGLYLTIFSPKPTSPYANDIAPGSNKAVLTLASGKQISLTDVKAGEIAKQSGIEITKSADGQLVYTVTGKSKESSLNTIETPNGGQYMVCLSDGTKVWLNAASTLKFPAQFNGATRDVELSGEAYFEVAKDKKKPFNVTSNMQRVQVLGTHFNIHNYVSESFAKTTLLEGSVKVTALTGASSATLQPGMQSSLENNVLKTASVNTEEVVAWQKGYFMFNKEPLENIMNSVSRWYDVDIIYQDQEIRKNTFWGTIDKFKSVSQVLKVLELTGEVHFKIQGRKIIVSN